MGADTPREFIEIMSGVLLCDTHQHIHIGAVWSGMLADMGVQTIRRLYDWDASAPGVNTRRGASAQRTENKVLWVRRGWFKVIVRDADPSSDPIEVDVMANQALSVPAGVWLEVQPMSPDTYMLVITDKEFYEGRADFIDDLEEFFVWHAAR